MGLRDWFRPPRHVLTSFLAVALVCGSALGWLAWQLLQQDKAVDAERHREQLEDAADRSVVAMQQLLARLDSLLSQRANSPPREVTLVSVSPGGNVSVSGAALLYLPQAERLHEASPATFAEADRLEFTGRDLPGAVAISEHLAKSGDPAVQAGALTRLGRIYRKLHDTEKASAAYQKLELLAGTGTSDLPSSLVAREGRASLFSESNRLEDLAREAEAMVVDLRAGRWQITKDEYRFLVSEAAEWLGRAVPESSDAVARAEAFDWLWRNRASGVDTSRRLVRSEGSTALVTWNHIPDRSLRAVIAGPAWIEALSRATVSDGFRIALTDPDGDAISGGAPPSRGTVFRNSAATALPWGVSVFATGGAPAFSERRRLLIWVFAVIAVVLSAGGYFILHAISREIRVARLQTDFVAAVSHEFRSPLSSMAQISEMLVRDRFPSEDLRRRSYEILAGETARLRRLVENLLDFGRFENPDAGYRFETIPIVDFVREIVADFGRRAAESGYTVELAAPESDISVRADREALARAIWNLLDNAVKYSPECHTVWVEMRNGSGRIEISVRDRGLGIPASEQREIFDKFVRGAQSKALHIKGTGVGLAMVRGIVRAHGGEIRLASQPGEGSQFTMVLRTGVLHTGEGMP